MTQMSDANPKAMMPKRSNIYTVLAMVGALALLVGIIFVATRNIHLTGVGNPFAVVSADQVPVSK